MAGFGDGAARVGRRGVEERTDRWGPCVSEGRERRRQGWKAGIKEENVLCEIRQRRARADVAAWAGWADFYRKIQRVLIFEFK
jgi:hypothetical protein